MMSIGFEVRVYLLFNRAGNKTTSGAGNPDEHYQMNFKAINCV